MSESRPPGRRRTFDREPLPVEGPIRRLHLERMSREDWVVAGVAVVSTVPGARRMIALPRPNRSPPSGVHAGEASAVPADGVLAWVQVDGSTGALGLTGNV